MKSVNVGRRTGQNSEIKHARFCFGFSLFAGIMLIQFTSLVVKQL